MKPEYYDSGANWSLIPQHMHEGIAAHVMQGRPVGHFLTALLENDFMRATERADDANARSLLGWAKFLYNYCPTDSYGSPAKVKAWKAAGGLNGIAAALATDDREAAR